MPKKPVHKNNPGATFGGEYSFKQRLKMRFGMVLGSPVKIPKAIMSELLKKGEAKSIHWVRPDIHWRLREPKVGWRIKGTEDFEMIDVRKLRPGVIRALDTEGKATAREAAGEIEYTVFQEPTVEVRAHTIKAGGLAFVQLKTFKLKFTNFTKINN